MQVGIWVRQAILGKNAYLKIFKERKHTVYHNYFKWLIQGGYYEAIGSFDINLCGHLWTTRFLEMVFC